MSTTPSAREYEPQRSESSLGDLVTELTDELSTLFRKEIELAKTEAREEMGHAGKAAALFGGAGVAGWLALLFLSLALAWLIDQGTNTAVAFAIVGVAWTIAALGLQTAARKRLANVRGLPETKRSIKEDMEWARAQKS